MFMPIDKNSFLKIYDNMIFTIEFKIGTRRSYVPIRNTTCFISQNIMVFRPIYPTQFKV